MNIFYLANAGGLFAILVFIHFVSDWVFQSHETAMKKHHDRAARALHCFYYTLPFLFFLYFLKIPAWGIASSGAVLFLSHYVGDSYKPVYVWMKHIRRVPIVTDPMHFKRYLQESPLGLVLAITIDQLFHITFLWYVVWVIL